MAMGPGSSRGIKSDINVTPLVDVVLVLLIIFMVVTPLLQRGKDVKLPRAARVEAEKKTSDPIILSITVDRHTFLESEEVTPKSLEMQLRDKLARLPNRKVLLKGDTSLAFEDIRKVMDVARK